MATLGREKKRSRNYLQGYLQSPDVRVRVAQRARGVHS